MTWQLIMIEKNIMARILRRTFLIELNCLKRGFVDDTIHRSIVANIIIQKVTKRNVSETKIRSLQTQRTVSDIPASQLDNIRAVRPDRIVIIPAIEEAIKIRTHVFERRGR
jgi:hypothetical protein